MKIYNYLFLFVKNVIIYILLELNNIFLYLLLLVVSDENTSFMRRKEMDQKTAAWKYIVAVIVFVLLLFFGASILSIFTSLLNCFTPEYYKPGSLWIQFLATIVATVAACWLIVVITDYRHLAFCTVLCSIGSIYMIVTAIINLSIGCNNGSPDYWAFSDVLLTGIICGIAAFIYGTIVRDNKEDTTVDDIE